MRLDWKACFRICFSVFVLYLCIHYWEYLIKAFKLFLSACTPLIIGACIAYLLNIVMSFYEKHYFPNTKNKLILMSRRVVCLILAILSFVGFGYLIVQLIVPELISCIRVLANAIPIHISNFIKFLEQNEVFIEYVIPTEALETLNNLNWQDIISKIAQVVTSGFTNVVGTVANALSSVVSSVITIFFSVIFSIYLLLDKDRLANQTKRILKAYLSEKTNSKIYYFTGVLNKRFRGFIIGQCIEAFILGVLCTIGMSILRLPYAFMIGSFIGFTAIIPIAGAYLGAVVGAFMIMTVSPIQSLIFIVFLIVLQQFEEHAIYPNVVGEAIDLSGLWVLAAVTIGGGMFGVPGMLIGVPLIATIYQIVGDHVRKIEGERKDVV